MELVDAGSGILRVEQIYREDLCDETRMVYNFQVEEFHTYHVGTLGVLVHNADYVDGSGTKKVNRSKNIERQAKKLSPEARKGYEKAIKALENGDTRGLNDHALSGNRSGQKAIDIKGTGKGRGAGRLIYEFGEAGEINIIEIITDHKY